MPTPASPPALVPTRPPTSAVAPATAPTETPSGAVVNILPTRTPLPVFTPVVVPTPNCTAMAKEPARMAFAPLSQKADVITYVGLDGLRQLDGLYQFDLVAEKSTRIISVSKDIWMYGLKWSPDRKYFAFARALGDLKCPTSQLIVADTISGEAVVATSFENRISIFGWTPDSRFVTIGTEKQVLNIDASGKLKPTQLAVPQVVREWFWINSASAVYLSKSAETSSPNALFLWKSQSGESKKIDEGFLYDADLSPDNKRMAISHILPNGKMGLKIVDIASAAIQTVDMEGEGIYRLQWSPDGRYLLAHVGLGAVILVDTQNKHQVRQLGFYAVVADGAWNRDGSQFVVILATDGGKQLPQLGVYTLKTGEIKAYSLGPLSGVIWRR